EAADEVEQRGLAAARRPRDGHELCGGHGERDVVERGDTDLAQSVGLADVVDGDPIVHRRPLPAGRYPARAHHAWLRARRPPQSDERSKSTPERSSRGSERRVETATPLPGSA